MKFKITYDYTVTIEVEAADQAKALKTAEEVNINLADRCGVQGVTEVVLHGGWVASVEAVE